MLCRQFLNTAAFQMKMPATTTNKVESKPSTDIGDVAKQCLNGLEKKVRNLEKRKGRIEQNQDKAKKGVKLEKEQEDSLQQYDQVMHCLEFARELQKQFLQINQEHEKVARKQAKREKAERQAMEIKRISEILQLQTLLDFLGRDTVREDFKTGKHGAVVLTEDNLNQLDELYQAISPSRDDSGDEYPQRLTLAAEHLVNYLDGKDRQVVGTTYKELKELITLIIECGYFERTQNEETTDIVTQPSENTEVAETPTEEPESDELISSNEQEQTCDSQQQQPIDLTIGAPDAIQSQRDVPAQTLSALEQDAFFAPSSLPYQADVNPHFTQANHTAVPRIPDYPSFTNGPFQFIQASYIMPDSTAPGIVDPAVIIAQPAVSSGLQFISQRYETQPHVASQMQQLPTQPQQQQNQTVSSMVDMTHQHQSTASHQPQQVSQDYSSQNFQDYLHCTRTTPSVLRSPTIDHTRGISAQCTKIVAPNLQTGSLFPVQGVGEVSDTLPSHSSMMGQLREANVSALPYEIPPSIPMPPSLTQDQISDQQHMQEKKFQMNVSAPVFQSMYSQVNPEMASGPALPTSVPQPSVPSVAETQILTSAVDFSNKSIPGGDFGQSGAGDYQQSCQTNSEFPSGAYARSGHGGFQGDRAASGSSEGSSSGGLRGNPMQNGLNGRGGNVNTNSSRGGRGGTYQGYPPSNSYRPDSFQGTYNSYNKNRFSGGAYQKRGGMNSGGFPHGGTGGDAGRGGMRGGMTRGASGGSRGASRGGFSRPLATQ